MTFAEDCVHARRFRWNDWALRNGFALAMLGVTAFWAVAGTVLYYLL